jgi:nitrite reductase/ring-hydroxylating ferredoxin subunit
MKQPATGEPFPAYPASWYLFCRSRRLRPGPLARDALGRRLVAFRTPAGRVALLDASCSHLGADLGRGRVVGESLHCPFHHWEYGPDGRCTRIPARESVPDFARQASYPVEERNGLVFFFNGPRPLFPLPFFEGRRPEEFLAAAPWEAVIDCPWYMVAGNAFDAQHFAAAHDRRLTAAPVIDRPGPFARRATCRLAVAGRSWWDRLTRRFAGAELEMTMTCWAGNIVLVRAAFPRTCSYGLVVTEPLGPGRTLVRIVIFQERSAWRLARALLDPLRLWVRRLFIVRFVAPDAEHLSGARYSPSTLIDEDRALADYYEWVASAWRGEPARDTPANGVPLTGYATPPLTRS